MAFSSSGSPLGCYKGTAAEYKPLVDFTRAEIIGVDVAGKWWYLKVDLGLGKLIDCWVSQRNVMTGGNLSAIPVAEPQSAQITDLGIYVTSNPRFVNCNALVDMPLLEFSGWIRADGPLDEVKYTWETSAPAQLALPGAIQIVGWHVPREVTVRLPVPARAGAYSLMLRSLAPNEMVSSITFVVQCAP
jgi:hypothetical protein